MPVAAIKDTTNIRSLIETAISELLYKASTEGQVDLRRASRSVFEDKCLDEVLWESFVDEWIDVAYELAGERTSYCDYHSLTDWCTCGHSADDHLGNRCDGCDCSKWKRSARAKRPTPRVKRSGYSPIDANRQRCIELENARFRQLFGDLTGGV